MRSSFTLVISLVILRVQAQDYFHSVSFFTDEFLSFSGNLIVPPRDATGGTPYLWPGLQPANNQGVLQPVLDDRDEHWYFGNAYVGTPSEPYGGGVDCSVGQTLGFYMTNIDGGGNWGIGVNNNGTTADYTFDVDLQMNQAIFAAELYAGTDWTFGNLVFEDVVLTASGADATWCTSTPHYSNVTMVISGLSSSVADNVVTCNIDSLTLAPP